MKSFSKVVRVLMAGSLITLLGIYPSSAISSAVSHSTTTYSCNSGDTRSGTVCTHTVAGTPAVPEKISTYSAITEVLTKYSCNSGDTRSGTVCTHTTPAIAATPDIVSTYVATTTSVPAGYTVSNYKSAVGWQFGWAFNQSYDGTQICGGNTASQKICYPVASYYSWGNPYVTYSPAKTTYSCNSGDTRSGTVCTHTVAGTPAVPEKKTTYSATSEEVITYSCNSGDTRSGTVCTHTVAGTPAVPEKVRTYSATSDQVITYSCPEGQTLIDQKCYGDTTDLILAPIPAVQGFLTSQLLPPVSIFLLLSISLFLGVRILKRFSEKLT